ncbi:MAG: divergent polysaccharide deacetylase family protein [Thermodesulfobacteriota bacterium]
MAKRSRGGGGKGSNSKSVLPVAIAGAILLLLVLVSIYRPSLDWLGGPKEVEKVGSIEEPPPPVVKPPQIRVAIVIDDMGRDLASLEEIHDLGVPITVAVLPYLAHSREVAEQADAAGGEVLLHLPMEPVDMAHNDPGEGALLISMSAEEVTAQMERVLDALPHIDGVNNHMGSRFSGDERLMRVVLESIQKRGGLLFLDSRTTADSKGYEIAADMGLMTAKREVFLDNRRDNAYIKGQLRILIERAKRDGKAIAIGHPHAETFTALREMAPVLEDEGVAIVPLSELAE